MTDDDTDPLPAWTHDLNPPPPVPEEVRQWLIGLEIARQQDAYRRDNPPKAEKQNEKEGKGD